jgi:hypothetical protein
MSVRAISIAVAQQLDHSQPRYYVPVLARKPGALRNGAPFKDWVLPGASSPTLMMAIDRGRHPHHDAYRWAAGGRGGLCRGRRIAFDLSVLPRPSMPLAGQSRAAA